MAEKLTTGMLVCLLPLLVEGCGDEDLQQTAQCSSQPGADFLSPRIIGRVKWYNASKGNGFITGRTHDDNQTWHYQAVFLHHSALPGEGFASLADGTCVEFCATHGAKGLTAENVTVLDECPEQLLDWAGIIPRTLQVISCEPTNDIEARPAIADSELAKKVRRIVAEQLGVKMECVRDSAYFVDDLGADSLDTVELVMAFEESFDIEITDEDAESITTVGDAIRHLQERFR